MKKIVIDVTDETFPKVTFIGDYISKREMDRVLRCIKKEHRRSIIEYRKRKIIEAYKLKESKNDGSNRQQEERPAKQRAEQPVASAASGVAARTIGTESSAAAKRNGNA